MNCSGYTYQNLPCKNKAKMDGRCWVHARGVTLDTVDLDRITSSEPFEMRQGDRTYYVSIDKDIGDLRAEVKKLKDRNKELDDRVKQLTRKKDALLEYSNKLNTDLLGYIGKIEVLVERAKYSVSFNAIMKVKCGGSLNMTVVDDKTGKSHMYIIARSEDIANLHQEIDHLKKTIAKKQPISRKPVVRNKPTDNYKEVKKENDKLNKAVESLKERVATHSAISKVCYTYEAFDEYINDTVERITGYTRDYPAGIYNKISDFMRIKSINKICYKELGISSAEFYKQFTELRDERNRTCHPPLKKRDKKKIGSFIVDYLKVPLV